jgi:hypothetical protein
MSVGTNSLVDRLYVSWLVKERLLTVSNAILPLTNVSLRQQGIHKLRHP